MLMFVSPLRSLQLQLLALAVTLEALTPLLKKSKGTIENITGEKVILGNRVFPSKVRAEEYLRRIKETHGPGDCLTGDEAAIVLDALQRHPACAEKVGPGVRRVGRYSNGDTLSEYGFGVERVDGSVVRFSYHMCFAVERRGQADRALEALRQAVRPYILRWRDRTLAKHSWRINCPITGGIIDPRACHVDHVCAGFATLVAAFLKKKDCRLNRCGGSDSRSLSGGGSFKPRAMATPDTFP
jgi:hypothetical protein